MAKTGFLLIDGNEALGRAPAAPRHWGEALVIVIVAQWIYWQGSSLASVIAYAAASNGILGASAWPAAAPLLYYLVIPSVIVAALAFYLSQRLDGRSPKALGIDLISAPTALPWAFAGLIVGAPHLMAVLTSGADMGNVARGAAVLTPVTIVQAGAEEVMFRGVILASLAARYGVRTGVVISALLFGLWHVSIGQSWADAGVYFAVMFAFGLTAGVATLHYANLGPAIALHVVWNVTNDLQGATSVADLDFWSAWATVFRQAWTPEELEAGAMVKFVFAPLLIEILIVAAVCRETVARLLTGRRASGVV